MPSEACDLIEMKAMSLKIQNGKSCVKIFRDMAEMARIPLTYDGRNRECD
jgi:hypothetical protein